MKICYTNRFLIVLAFVTFSITSIFCQEITESSIKSYWENNPVLKNEGFYRFTKVMSGVNYKLETKLALVFDEESKYYVLIYLNGYVSNLWKSGDFHAILKPTSEEDKFVVEYTYYDKNSVNYNWFCEIVGNEIKMYNEDRNYLFSYYKLDF